MTRNRFFRRQGACRKTIAALCVLHAGFPAAGASSESNCVPLLEKSAHLSEQVPSFKRVASFNKVESTATEQNGRIALKVTFSHAFSGCLNYRVDGTAERGADFDLPELKTAERRVDAGLLGPAREIDIVINLRDDELVEGVEKIRVTLLPGQGYRLEPPPLLHNINKQPINKQHIVNIQDNDTDWLVVHDVDGMRFEYGMRLIRNGDNTTATVTSDGGNGLPAGTYPVNLRGMDDSRFEAIVGPITVAADRTLLGAEIGRTFKLIAEPSRDPSENNGHKVDYDRLLIGTATETWTSESASHLTRSDPISGTFLMSRTIGGATSGNTREERSTGVAQDDNVGISGLGVKSECEVVDMSGTSSYAVRPGKPGSQTLRNPEMTRVSQPIVAPHIPYPNFVSKTLKQAREALYYDKAPAGKKNLAAFRYKALLYEKEKVGAEAHIRAQFDKIADLWSCAERKRAHQTAKLVIDALRYAPWNRELRWLLLDIYYDIAVAEKALAQEKHVAVAKLMIEPPGGDKPIIDKEIAVLEDTLPLYRNALAGYMKVIQGTFGVDVADLEVDPAWHGEPFGYFIFRQEVPHRSLSAALFQNKETLAWVLPEDAGIGDEQPEVLGHKDVTLLFELLREYLRTAEQLSKRYVIRNKGPDSDRAKRLIGDTLLATWLEGNALLAMFPEILEEGENEPTDPEFRLQGAVAGWRHMYSALGYIRSTLGGDDNILGFPDGLLILTQSNIPGDPSANYFHSFDNFKSLLKKDIGSLDRARTHLKEAREFYDNYRNRQDQLARQFLDRTEQYDERLREIVGVRPGESGYNDPLRNGGEISQQHKSVWVAVKRINSISGEIERLNGEIRIRIEEFGKKMKINKEKRDFIIKYGEEQAQLSEKGGEEQARLSEKGGKEQARLSEEIARINAKQRFWQNIVNGVVTAAGAAGSLAVIMGSGGAATPLAMAVAKYTIFGAAAGAGAQSINAPFQESREEKKGARQASKEREAASTSASKERLAASITASKERHAAAKRAELVSLQGELLEVDFQAGIKKLWLQMSPLEIELERAVLDSVINMERLSALYREKKSLERRKAEFNKQLAERYFADPSHRLLSNAAVLRSESSFTNAQRWLFLAIRAGEYKWNRPFVHTDNNGVIFNKQTLFSARNAEELDELFNKLTEWDARIPLSGTRTGGQIYKLSLRKLFGYKVEFSDMDKEGQKCDFKTGLCKPKNNQSMQNLKAFQNLITRPDNYMNPWDDGNPMDPRFTKVLKLNFSTAAGADGLFLSSRWNEKVNFLKIELEGTVRQLGADNTTLAGYLTYGGSSWIRNQNPNFSDRRDPVNLVGETTEYPVRSWAYDGSQWTSKETFGSDVIIQLGRDPDLTEAEYRTPTFKEFSVATTDWTLYIPVEYDHMPLVDITNITDILFHIGFYYYTH